MLTRSRINTMQHFILLLVVCVGYFVTSNVNMVGANYFMTNQELQRVVLSVIEHHSFTPPLLQSYYGDGELPFWASAGSTVITDNYVRLTAESKNQKGQFWNLEPLDLDAFEVIFGFRVTKPFAGGGEGFAMWMVSEIPQSTGPLFGHPMKFTGLGIMFDVFDNDYMRDNPKVGLITNDGSNPNKVFSPQRDFRGEFNAMCVFDFRGVHGDHVATARFRYDHGHIQLFLSRDNEHNEKLCFDLPAVPIPNIDSKTLYYLGLTAETGGSTEIHDISFFHVTPLEGEVYTHDIYATQQPPQQNTPQHRRYTPVYNHRAQQTTQPPHSRSPPTPSTTTTTTTTTTLAPTQQATGSQAHAEQERLKELERQLEELRKQMESKKEQVEVSETLLSQYT